MLPAREHARAFYAEVMHRAGVVARRRRDLRDRALVLMYHRVLPADAVPDDIKPGMYVTTDTFAKHLDYLASHHEVVSLDDIYEWLAGRRQFSRIPCAITFDDGWEDNYTHAFPLLRGHRMTATIFVITDQLGRAHMMTWSQVREMEQTGISFGSHTATHPVLTALDEPAVRDELTRSWARLQDEVRRPSRWFCYPKGAYNNLSLGVARELYAAALSTEEGPIARGDDLHHLQRIAIHNDVTRTKSLFACRLVALV